MKTVAQTVASLSEVSADLGLIAARHNTGDESIPAAKGEKRLQHMLEDTDGWIMPKT